MNILNVLFFSLEISLRSYWKDLGIKPAEKYMEGSGDNEKYVTVVPSEWTDKIWMPDIVIMHAINLRTPTYNLEPSSLRYTLFIVQWSWSGICCRVYNDNMVRHSKLINFDIACPMKFHRYPFDIQSCQIRFESYGYTADKLKMKWRQDPNCQVEYLLFYFCTI